MSMEAIEQRVHSLESWKDKTDTILDRISQDLRQQTIILTRQDEDREAMKRAFRAIEKVEESVDEMRENMQKDTLTRMQDLNSQQAKIIERQDARQTRVVIEILKIAGVSLIVTVGTILGAKFGLHLL